MVSTPTDVEHGENMWLRIEWWLYKIDGPNSDIFLYEPTSSKTWTHNKHEMISKFAFCM